MQKFAISDHMMESCIFDAKNGIKIELEKYQIKLIFYKNIDKILKIENFYIKMPIN